MRVTGSTGPRVRSADGSGGRPTLTEGFSLPGPRSAASPASVSRTLGTASLLGLQDIAPLPMADRRRRAVKRGLSLLDRLDELRLLLLDGAVPLPALRGLRAELGRSGELDGDERLRGLLDAIDVRCAVEVAKLEAAPATG